MLALIFWTSVAILFGANHALKKATYASDFQPRPRHEINLFGSTDIPWQRLQNKEWLNRRYK